MDYNEKHNKLKELVSSLDESNLEIASLSVCENKITAYKSIIFFLKEIRFNRLSDSYSWRLQQDYIEFIQHIKTMKTIISWIRKTNEQIADEIFEFVNPDLGFPIESYNNSELKEGGKLYGHFEKHNVGNFDGFYYAKPTFYGYYSDYDWVVFCWLYGKMINLKSGFPYYCIDLQQLLNEEEKNLKKICSDYFLNTDWLDNLKNHPDYPKQKNEHDAISDARWNKKLHEFIKNIRD